MIRMYPRALVLTTRHPYGGTEMMAQSVSYALNANGYDARIVNVSDASVHSLPALLEDADLRLVMTTGTIPLAVTVNGMPIWQAVGPQVQFVTYVIDAWPYDAVRVEPFRAYLAAWPSSRNLHVASLEGHDARLIGPRAHHMPTGAYPAPWRTGRKEHPRRLMVWASAHRELAVTPLHSAFEDTLRDNNPWGFDPARIRTIADRLRGTDLVHGLSAIADAFGTTSGELVRPDHLSALCAVDSCLKRHRRVTVVRALRGLPVDVYGENWAQYVGDEPSMRLLVPNPNHNHAFSYLCQHYAGLVNFDPNFGDGTNERAVSALALGVPIANNFNLRTDGVAGVYPYRFEPASIRDAACALLEHATPVPVPLDNTWEWRVGDLLRRIATASAPAPEARLAEPVAALA